MKLFNAIFAAMLFANVLAIGMHLHKTDADPIYYVNLAGCIVFGGFTRKFLP